MTIKTVSWDQVFMSIAEKVALKSKDPSTQVGAVLVDEKHVLISVGFNGPPRSIADNSVPFDVRPDKYDWLLHAELNAVLFGLRKQDLTGTTLFVTTIPCKACCLLCAQVGIARIVYGATPAVICDDANNKVTFAIARAAGILLEAMPCE